MFNNSLRYLLYGYSIQIDYLRKFLSFFYDESMWYLILKDVFYMTLNKLKI